MYKHTIKNIEQLDNSSCNSQYLITSKNDYPPKCSDDYVEVYGNELDVLKYRLGFDRITPDEHLVGTSFSSACKTFESAIRRLVENPPVIPHTLNIINKEIIRAVLEHTSPNFPENDEAVTKFFDVYDSIIIDDEHTLIDRGWIECFNRMIGGNRISENKTPSSRIKGKGLYFIYNDGEKISEYVLCYSHNIIEKMN